MKFALLPRGSQRPMLAATASLLRAAASVGAPPRAAGSVVPRRTSPFSPRGSRPARGSSLGPEPFRPIRPHRCGGAVARVPGYGSLRRASHFGAHGVARCRSSPRSEATIGPRPRHLRRMPGCPGRSGPHRGILLPPPEAGFDRANEKARRGGPSRSTRPLACYLIVSFRWLSSFACLTIVIL